MVMAPSSETDALAGPPDSPIAPPRRVKVRVRRKNPTAPLQEVPNEVSEINMELEETTILPNLVRAPRYTPPGMTASIAPSGAFDPETSFLFLPSEDRRLPVEAAPTQESALDTDTTILSPSAVERSRPVEDTSIGEEARSRWGRSHQRERALR